MAKLKNRVLTLLSWDPVAPQLQRVFLVAQSSRKPSIQQVLSPQNQFAAKIARLDACQL
jgi:hypothetical protein